MAGAPPSPASDTRVVRTSDGVDLVVEEAGEGAAVLLVPGLGYGAWSFAELAADLAGDHRVVRLDNRGTGRSGKPAGGYAMARLARDVVEVVTALDLGPTHLLGTSMGGYVVLRVAQAAPAAVGSLTLVATSVGGSAATPVPPETLDVWQAASELSPAAYARATMPLSFRTGWVEEYPAAFEAVLSARLAHPTPMHVWSEQLAACERFLEEGLGGHPVQQPTLVVHGTADRVVPYANALYTCEQIPHARLRTLEDAGHLCWIEQPVPVAAAVRTHIEEVERAVGSGRTSATLKTDDTRST